MARPFAWGIVGTGAIARQFAADLAHVPDAVLGGVCSRDAARAEAFRAEFGADRAYAELDAMLGDKTIDAVYVATPNTLHAEQALRAIAHGKPVLVEKPLAVSAPEARRVEAAAAAGGCFVMEAMWSRFLPAVRAMKRRVEDGAIGRIRMVRAELSYRREEDRSRLFDPALGGGAALDLGVYPLSLALHLLGRPTTVSGTWKMSNSGVDMRSAFDLEFDGVAASLACGFDRDGANQFVIEGTEGVLRLDAPFLKARRLVQYTPGAFALIRAAKIGRSGAHARLADRLPLPGRQAWQFPFAGGGLQFEAMAVMEAVRGGEAGSQIMPLGDSIAVLDIIDKVLGRGGAASAA